MTIPVPTVALRAVDDFLLPVPDRQPAGHGFSRAVFHAPGLSRQPAARHQPLPDERTFPRPARARQQAAATFRTTSSASRRFPSRCSPSDSTYAIFKNDFILRKATPWLNKIGFHDLDQGSVRPTAAVTNPNASACWVFPGRPVRCSRKSAANGPICCRKSSSWISIRSSMKNCASAASASFMATSPQRDVLHHAGVAHAKSSSARCPTWCSRARTT